nr:hypothetical protein [Sphingomonas yunnanensis]
MRRTSLDAALAVVRTDKGQALSERIDGVLARCAEREQGLLAARMAEEERDTRRTATAAALAEPLSLLSAAFGISFF